MKFFSLDSSAATSLQVRPINRTSVIVTLLSAITVVTLAGSAMSISAAPIDESEPPNGELWVQNLHPGPPRNLTSMLVGEDGIQPLPLTLMRNRPLSSNLLRLGWVSMNVDDGRYAAFVGGDSTEEFPAVAIARTEWPASGGATVLGATESASTAVIPFVARRAGISSHSSLVSIQNADTGSARTIDLVFTAMGASAPTLSTTVDVAAGASVELDLATDVELPNGFVGVMEASGRSGAKVAAAATTEISASDQAVYGAEGATYVGPRLVAPRIVHQFSETIVPDMPTVNDSFIAVMNLDTTDTSVSIDYIGTAGACAGMSYTHAGGPAVIPAGGGGIFAHQTIPGIVTTVGASTLPLNCAAAAVITSSSGNALAAVVVELEDDGERAAAYPALPAAENTAAASQRIAHVPLFRRDWRDISSSVDVMNAGGNVTLAEATLTYIEDDATKTAKVSTSLEPGAAAHWDIDDFGDLPQRLHGSIEVKSSRSGVRVVAVARETSDDGSSDNTLFSSFTTPIGVERPEVGAGTDYPSFLAPSVWHSNVYDVGLISAGTTDEELERLKKAINAQAHEFSQRTGFTIASATVEDGSGIDVEPYMIDGEPFHVWLQDQAATGYPDVSFRARTVVAGLNYNGVVIMGRAGDLAPATDLFPSRGDFLEDAWNLNFVRDDEAMSAVPWVRMGCAPSYRNLATLDATGRPSVGFDLIRFLTDEDQQRESYAPTVSSLGQIGYPTLETLYGSLGITCPDYPNIERTDKALVADVEETALEDADELAALFSELEVDLYDDQANAAKAVGSDGPVPDGAAAADGDLRSLVPPRIVAQPMHDRLTEEEMETRINTAQGLTVGTLSITILVEPTNTAVATPTRTSTPTPTMGPDPTDTPTATSTSGPGPSDTPTPTDEPGATNTPEPTDTVEPGPSDTPTPTDEPGATNTPEPTDTVEPGPTDTPGPSDIVATIYMPFTSNQYTIGEIEDADGSSESGRNGDRVGNGNGDSDDRSNPLPDVMNAQPGGRTQYAVVWRGSGIDSITPTLIDSRTRRPVDLGSIGVTAMRVETSFRGGIEPEAWVEKGSVIVCFSLNRVRSCLRIED